MKTTLLEGSTYYGNVIKTRKIRFIRVCDEKQNFQSLLHAEISIKCVLVMFAISIIILILSLFLPPVNLCQQSSNSTAILSRSISYFSLSSIVKWGENNPYPIQLQPTPPINLLTITISPSKLLTQHGYNSYRTNHATWTSHSVMDERKSGTYHKLVQILGSSITAFISQSGIDTPQSFEAVTNSESLFPWKTGL